jgi:prophage maintenance system killer protein
MKILLFNPFHNQKRKTTMSNNKQTDIKELAITEYPFGNSERNAFINGYNKAKELHKNQTIELPSDKDIDKEATDLFSKTTKIYISIIQCKAFKQGAKWMRNKIQGGEQ